MNSEFRKFATQWEFDHQTSSPHHQQSNGKAESAVKIAKYLLKKAVASNTDFYKSLLIWRNTPNKIGSSPAKRLFCRWLRCDIPAMNLSQEVIPDIPKLIRQQKIYNKKYFDKGTQKEKEFKEGDKVYIKINPKENWIKGKIEKKVSNRSYMVRSNNRQYRRNSIHIMKPESKQQETSEPIDLGNCQGTEQKQQSNEETTRVERQYQPIHITNLDQSTGLPGNIATEDPERNVSPTRNQQDEQPVQRPRRESKLPKRLNDYEIY